MINPMTGHATQAMTPTDHEKAEWVRCALAAYKASLTDIGHKLSAAAATAPGARMPLPAFREAQDIYRNWLVFNEWPKAEPATGAVLSSHGAI